MNFSTDIILRAKVVCELTNIIANVAGDVTRRNITTVVNEKPHTIARGAGALAESSKKKILLSNSFASYFSSLDPEDF